MEKLKRCLQGDKNEYAFLGLGVGMSKLSSPAFSSPGVLFHVSDKYSGMHLICAKMFLNFVYEELMFDFDLS